MKVTIEDARKIVDITVDAMIDRVVQAFLKKCHLWLDMNCGKNGRIRATIIDPTDIEDQMLDRGWFYIGKVGDEK